MTDRVRLEVGQCLLERGGGNLELLAAVHNALGLLKELHRRARIHRQLTNRHVITAITYQQLVSDIAIFVLKRDVKLQLTNLSTTAPSGPRELCSIPRLAPVLKKLNLGRQNQTFIQDIKCCNTQKTKARFWLPYEATKPGFSFFVCLICVAVFLCPG